MNLNFIEDSCINIRGRITDIRNGKTMNFVLLEKNGESIQVVIPFDFKTNKQSVIDVYGTLKSTQKDVNWADIKKYEIMAEKIDIVSISENVLPICYKFKNTSNKKTNIQSSNQSSLELRLDNRFIDLRQNENKAIMQIKAAVCKYFRQFFDEKGFMEIQTPKIIRGSSEGGSDVFPIKYFEKTASLAQSPQLYKQMAINSDFASVYEIGPVFRAENSHTHRHLTEFTGLDIEMRLESDETELIQILHKLLAFIISNLSVNYSSQLCLLYSYYNTSPICFDMEKPLCIDYKYATELLSSRGCNLHQYQDISTEQEKLLGSIIKELHNTDLFFLCKFPSCLRPFYTRTYSDNPLLSHSFDIILRGQEICSGSQRVHSYSDLLQRLLDLNISSSSLSSYLDSFRYGTYPHGGAGLGLERLVMLIIGLPDIRLSSMYPRDPIRLFP